MRISSCLKLTILVLCICDIIITPTVAQKQAKKKKVPAASSDGRWRPTNKRRKPTNQRPTNSNTRGAVPRPVAPRERIFPVLRRHKDELPLQQPSWTHCINNIEVPSNWATIMNEGYRDGIHGQYQCTWILHGSPGSRVRISFEEIDLQARENGKCNSQFVDIIDSLVQKSQGRFCGNKVPGDYVTLGTVLRVDIQADKNAVAHKGFIASVRVEPKSVQPGLRERSSRAQGPATLPPTLPPMTRAPIRRRTTIRTSTVKTIQPKQQQPINNVGFYGRNYQPEPKNEETRTKSGNLDIYVYVLIAVGCFVILMLGTAYIFRRSLINRVKKIRGKEEKFEEEKKTPHHNDDYYDNNQRRFPLPQDHVTTGFDTRRRRSVIFEDEYLAAMERDQQSRDAMNAGLRRSASLSSVYNPYPAFQGWDYPFSEPVYDDDRQSVRSMDSVRSSMRHPEHEQYKRMKQMERNNALKRNNEYEIDHYTPKYIPHNNAAYYDDTVDLQRQQGAMMMKQLSASQSMNDVSMCVEDNLHKSRSASVADIPVEGTLLKRQLLRRQSFHM